MAASSQRSERAPALLLLAGGFLVGGLCVAGYALLAARETRDPGRSRDAAAQAEVHPSAQPQVELAQESRTQPVVRSGSADGSAAEARSELEGWWSQALQAMARDGMARGWAEVRQDAMPANLAEQGLTRFRTETEALPPRIGRELAEQRGRDDLVEAGIEAAGVFTFLELLDEDAIGPFPDLVEDSGRFGALFACAIAGPTLSGSEYLRVALPTGTVLDGTLIRFEPGVAQISNWGVLPRCLTIEGAGMDKTLLRMAAFHDYQRVEQLVVRDCTLFATGVDVLDFRGKGSQVLFERVRVIGFDAGAGGSNALSLDHTALLARDCRFEGGYGRNASGGGTLFDVRTSALLARFERCRFEAMELELEDLRGRATVIFSECDMVDLRDLRDPRTVERPGIRLVNCSVKLAEPDPEHKRDWSRDLDELFPGWQEAR